MKTLIIQTSPCHTASTFLINALYGLIPELNNTKIIGFWNENHEDDETYNFEKYFNDIIVIKCHNINIDNLISKYSNYKLYFVCSERKDTENTEVIDTKYKLYNNVVVFDFNELNETDDNTIPKIIQNIYNKIQGLNINTDTNTNIDLNIESGINRITLMNKRYQEIKHLPFSYIDDFYEIHGSHRNRK